MNRRIVCTIIIGYLLHGCAGSSLFGDIGTEMANPLSVFVNSTAQRAYIVNANDKYAYNSGSLHIVDLSTITAPTRVNSTAIDSFGGQVYVNATTNLAFIPNRLSVDDQDTIDALLQVDVNEVAGTFTVTSIAANGNPFGAALDTTNSRLLVPTGEGTLDIYDVSGTSVSRSAQVDLKVALSDGSTITSAPLEEAVVFNADTQAVVTRGSGGAYVINMSEVATSGAVDYYIDDIEDPRGIATDGTLIYVVDVVNDGASDEVGYLRVLDLSTLTVDAANTTATVEDKDDNSLQQAEITVGSDPQEVVVSANLGRAYVSNLADDTVTVIDTTTQAVVGTAIAVGDEPFGMALYQQVAGTDSHLLVCNRQGNTVSIIDLASGTVVATYP